MLRHLFLTLFLAMLALPALASPLCAETPPPATEHCAEMGQPADHAPKDRPDHGAAAQHGCIGCIAPSLAAPAIVVPMAMMAEPAPARVAAFAGLNRAPPMRPPRA